MWNSIVLVYSLFALAHAKPLAQTPVNPSPTPSIKVSLFGSPCSLKGNFETAALQATHAISPEQIQDPSTLEQAKKNLERARNIKDLPKQLEIFRDKLVRRLTAISKYFSILPQVTKSKNFEALFEAVKGHIGPARLNEFKLSGRKYLGAGGNPVNSEALTELFKNCIEPYPEEDFHRMISQMGIRYQCTFEEAGAEDPIEE